MKREMQANQAELRRFSRDVDYYQAHREDLLSKYPDQWVAIFNQRVVGAHSDYERLLDQLEENHVPLGRVFIELATRKDELLILPL